MCLMETANIIDNEITTIKWKIANGCLTVKEGSHKIAGIGCSYQKGDSIGPWDIVYIGDCMNKPTVILENNNNNGSSLYILQDQDTYEFLRKYSRKVQETGVDVNKGKAAYFGMNLKDVLNSGRDILGKKALENGEPSYDGIKQILPPIKNGSYIFISGSSSWGGVLILPNGNVIPQESGNNRNPVPIFSPVELDNVLGNIPPKQYLVDGWIPVVVSVHELGDEVLEIMYFIEPDDPDRDPLVWIRAQKYNSRERTRSFDELFVVSQSRPVRKSKIDPEIFWDAFITGIAFWKDCEKEMSEFNIPEENVKKCLKGTMASLLTTFSGDHAHYGHRWYGCEIHDNFPPNYLTAIETCHAMGMNLRARRYAEHVLAYCIDAAGRFVYRQGPKEVYGASGTEYGQWLWLVNRLEPVLPPKEWLKPYIDVLIRMGHYLVQNRVEVPECNGRRLIRMCAEADNNNRIYAYSCNNLWAVRGLQALGFLLNRYGRKESQYFLKEAADLENELRSALEEAAVKTEFGRLLPFQFGYTATPLTLSSCKDTFYPVNEDTFKEYLSRREFRDNIKGKQDLSENTYANYRYYPEMLSAMLLSNDESDAIVKLRENLGGECLGMTRVFSFIDDWPAANYARFLLATDRIDKYLLLLYSHMAHHGNPDLMVYYEQVTLDGSVAAPDCVPSVLLAPIMTAWMFCFEPPGENSVYLLRGIPSKWLKCGEEFGVSKIGCTFGNISIQVKSGVELIEVLIILPQEYDGRAVYLDLRLSEELMLQNIVKGREFVKSIEKGYRIRLKDNTCGTVGISFKKQS